jgi:glyoxylase-like metal-dependent hydrolase (beta-lactamase superfamily II)
MVFFRRSDVIATGDIFNMDSYPVVNVDKGGNIQGVLKALNVVLDITIPKHEQEGGTYVIPGHGRLTDEHDVLEYRDMVTIIRDRVQNMIKKGMTLAQVKEAKPTFEYDGRWSAATGPGSTDMFVEAVFRSLTPKR